ncbi:MULTISPECIES: N-acetylneuraminate synthase family protein [Sphingomonas]|uniref:N-acetylneuraminate synthase family protein n=1 Tax=Sphingomonas TaxID=13687 RepID=UPI000F7E869A|nr:N-acetylneuraminate synthase family protein [Sphingomonas sp. ABOLF]RSV14689.1 N-acetylneuraminate synthase [Sphingomonas sp. ABOLF]GLK19302.1 N-acetylneuraminate synthase [Microbacterium terregens]
MSVKVIAEVGCNHMGSMDIAKELIQVAAIYAKADVVKFQKRNNRELLTEAQYNAPHPNPANSYGDTYGAHREFLEFNVDQHHELKAECEKFGIEYSTSVWDTTSAREMATLKPSLLKVPSACNLHFEMLDVLAKDFDGDIHLSLGMTTHDEEQQIVDFFVERGRAKDLVLYACTSGYPVAFDDLCLLEVTRLKDKFGDKVKSIAFSGHHLGIAADMAAVALGAEWVERHFTMDRTWKGTDHSASLEPDGLRRLCRDVRAVAKSLKYKSTEILPVEQVQRDKLKWRPKPKAAEAA